MHNDELVLVHGEEEYDWKRAQKLLEQTDGKNVYQLTAEGVDRIIAHEVVTRLRDYQRARQRVIDEIITAYGKDEFRREFDMTKAVGSSQFIDMKKRWKEVFDLARANISTKMEFSEWLPIEEFFNKQTERQDIGAIQHMMSLGKKRFNEVAATLLRSEWVLANEDFDFEKVIYIQ